MAPDVCDIVEYGSDFPGAKPHTYRVDGWLKRHVKPFKVTGYDMMLSGAMFVDLDHTQRMEFILQPILDEIASERTSKKDRLAWCSREEATHVSLSGICGAIAAIDACNVVGRVSWSKSEIQEHIDSANFRAESGDVTDCFV